jgi:hypothetical protein
MPPANASGLEQIDNGGHILGDVVEPIIIDAKVIAAEGRCIVGLARVRHGTEMIVSTPFTPGSCVLPILFIVERDSQWGKRRQARYQKY